MAANDIANGFSNQTNTIHSLTDPITWNHGSVTFSLPTSVGITTPGQSGWKLQMGTSPVYNAHYAGSMDECDNLQGKTDYSVCIRANKWLDDGEDSASWYMEIYYGLIPYFKPVQQGVTKPFGLPGLTVDPGNASVSENSVSDASSFVKFWYYDTIAWQTQYLSEYIRHNGLYGGSSADMAKYFSDEWPNNIDISPKMWVVYPQL